MYSFKPLDRQGMGKTESAYRQQKRGKQNVQEIIIIPLGETNKKCLPDWAGNLSQSGNTTWHWSHNKRRSTQIFTQTRLKVTLLLG